MKRFLLLLGGIVAVLAVVAGGFANQFQRYLASPMNLPSEGLVYEVPKGASFARVAAELAESGSLTRPDWLKFYARLSGNAERIQAGEYRIAAGTTPSGLLELLVQGDVLLHAFTIIEGWNRWELMDALGNDPQLEHTLTEDDWPGFLRELGSDAESPEGLFLPETYRFPAGTTDRELLGQAYELMQAALADSWAKRQESLPLATPYEALILASIIEKETAKADERPEIAGVFVRRLNKGMRLQTDPTVIYGIGPSFNGDITRRDLRTDTPYNTYRRDGLPPTPIAMPGRASIAAALNPAAGETLFFVATGLGDGSHKFSVTKDEHDAAVQEYLKRLRARRNGE